MKAQRDEVAARLQQEQQATTQANARAQALQLQVAKLTQQLRGGAGGVRLVLFRMGTQRRQIIGLIL